MNDDIVEQEQKEIDAGSRVHAFLQDKDVIEAMARLQRRYVDDWKAGDSPEKRETAWAKQRALDDLRTELEAVVESGKKATIVQSRRQPQRTASR